MELLKLINRDELLAQVAVFLILFFALRFFFWRRILALIDARREKISSQLKSIEDTQERINQLKADYESRLRDIDLEASLRMQRAIDDGLRKVEEIKNAANKEAAEVIQKARQEISYELIQAKVRLKKEIVDLTVKVVEELIQERLTEEEDRKLVMSFLDKIEDLK